MKMKGIKLIEDYKNNPGKYLPMNLTTKQMPERNEYGEVNIGWWAGLTSIKIGLERNAEHEHL